METVNQNQGIFLSGKALLAAVGLVFTSAAFANPVSTTYHYHSANELKSSIESSLADQQVDVSALEIKTDEAGAVSAVGDVASKEAADSIVKVLEEKDGVYSVYTRLVYPQI
jgi:osmotically-inducible protein OsmY